MIKRKMFTLAVLFLALLLLITSSVPACTPDQKVERFTVNDYSLWWGDECLWASVSVRDSADKWVTGLTQEDFQLTEALISPSGEVLQERAITFDEPDYQFEGDGFWERSVTDEKLDIVFLVDDSGSMEEEMPGISSELHKFVDRLESQHTDFRMAVMTYDWDIGGNYWSDSHWGSTMAFPGVMESKEIHQWLDDALGVCGEWWLPTVSYDRLMEASQLDFREEARKVIVVITDTIAQNIYGTYWDNTDATATCLSAVEQLFKDKDIEILYSQPDEKKLRHLIGETYFGYVSMDINPKAMAGFDTLGKRISWPFLQEDIKISGGSVTQSQYFFAWLSRLDVPDPHQDYRVKVTIKTADPEKSGEFLEETFTYVPYEQEARLVMTVTDEEGKPIDDVWVFLRSEMGDRRAYNNPYWQLAPEQGVIVIDDIPIGKYYLRVSAGGEPAHGTESLRYAKTGHIEVPKDGLELTLRVETGDREIELAKARGLLRDLDDWHSPGNPFKGFVADANKWLDDLEKDGITWQEIVAIKRFYMALAGYANITEYSQQMIDGATQNFFDIVQDFRDIVKQIKSFHESMELSWEEVLVEVVLDLITEGGATKARETAERYLKLLYGYVEKELLPELIEQVITQIPDGPYKPFIEIIINTCMGADFENWESVMETAKDLLLDEALDAVRHSVVQNLIETLFTELKLDTTLEKALVNNVADAVAGLLEGKLDNFDHALDKFSHDVGSYVLKEGREKVVTAVNGILHEAESKLEPSDARDFLFSMARDLVLLAIPRVESGKLNYSIDSDAVVRVLVKHSLYYIVLKGYYIDEARDVMYDTLESAKNYVPEGEAPDDWEGAMDDDFYEYRGMVEPLQEKAWRALETQEDIEDWAEALQGLVAILEPLGEALDILGYIHPAFEDMAEAVHGLIAVLDSIKIIPHAIEFGLRLDSLDTFGNSVEPLYHAVFPQP